MSNRERALLIALVVIIAALVHILTATYATPEPMCGTDRVMTVAPCDWPAT